MADFDDDFFRPPAPTSAGLMFPARSRETVRGFTLAKTPADHHWRQIISASQGERECCLLLLAQSDLWNLWDQPPPVSYVDDVGTQRSHRFDFLVEFRGGRRTAIAVKPSEQVKRLDFVRTLKCIQRDLPIGFADTVCLVTEKQRHPREVQNADLLNQFRRTPDPQADAIVSDLIAEITGEIAITDLVTRAGLGARTFRAVFRAIYAGHLQANRREVITQQSRVSPIWRDEP